MFLALTYDHRLIDGREAVTFLCSIRDKVRGWVPPVHPSTRPDHSNLTPCAAVPLQIEDPTRMLLDL